MLDRGSNSTDWSASEVIDMWLAISNQDTTAHWQVVTGWRRSYELTSEHLSAVKSYRANLAEAWPPEKNAASKAYCDRLDKLVDHLQQTYDSALANHEALRDAASALSLSRAKLDPIVTEYYANESKLQQFAAAPPPLQPGHGKTKAPAPKPPVPDGRQEELASQARSIMYSLGNDLTAAQAKISQPTFYDPAFTRSDDKDHGGGAADKSPSVPPVVPMDPRSFSSAPTTSTHLPSTAITNPGVGSSVTAPSSPHQPGLILGGTGQSPIAPPPTAISPLPGTGGLPTSPTVLTPTPGMPVGPIGKGLATPPAGFGGSRGMSREGLGRAGGPTRAMPPGGVIGSPGLGLGQPAAGSRPMQRVNPTGGVINSGTSQPRGGGSTGRGVSPSGQQVAGQGRRDGRESESQDSIGWDPDNPWETAEGVAPVLLPSVEQRVDPGPAIGLS